jgi:ribosomal protein S18 acetylase RimI-like enzyme
MTPIQTPGEVFDAIQRAKAGATAFCTNFFPVESKLRGWINHGELFVELRDGATFFFRKDRDFLRFYFCAADVAVLQREIAASPGLKTERVITDLVGNEPAVNEMLAALEPAGFRRHTQLQRLVRTGPAESATDGPQVGFAEKADGRAVLGLIENAFDRYGEQLPMLYEIELAIEGRQILAARSDGELAGLLFFETQGLASAVRFWAVAEKFRDLKTGSALIRHYFKIHDSVRRFTLWVNAGNENAIRKYRHFGYAPDGLTDHVLASRLIST